jgi:FkbM family methyltransferase
MTLPAQRGRIEEYVAAQGWELVGMHEDPHAGPGSGRRGPLLEGLGDLEGVDKLVITRLDTFPQSAAQRLDFIRALAAAGVDLVSVDDGFDTGTPAGKAVTRVISTLATFEQRVWQGWRLEILKKPGFAPRTVLDVGVARGTTALYEAFPEAYLVLIEPLVEFEPDLKRLVSEHGGEYVLVGAGAQEGTVPMTVDRRVLLSSSFRELLPDALDPEQAETRAVPMTTLDRLLEERGWTPPFGLKLDVEGFEDEVIKGATKVLAQTQFLIAEVTMTPRFQTGYSFAELIALMDARGFRLCDILAAHRSVELESIDALFRRKD